VNRDDIDAQLSDRFTESRLADLGYGAHRQNCKPEARRGWVIPVLAAVIMVAIVTGLGLEFFGVLVP
jgi:hypothetical protein